MEARGRFNSIQNIQSIKSSVKSSMFKEKDKADTKDGKKSHSLKRHFSRSLDSSNRLLNHKERLVTPNIKVTGPYTNLMNEFEDPSNHEIKNEIQRLIGFFREVSSLESDYDDLKRCKSVDSKLLDEMRLKNIDLQYNHKFTYNYTSYLKGLATLIEEYLNRLPKNKGRGITQTTNANIQNTKQSVGSSYKKTANSNINISSMTKKINSYLQNSALDSMYDTLGHEVYTKLINIFEKYCFYGKTYTNFNMDYSQFTTFMVQNKIYDKIITKTQSELIFNKIRNNNKSISFEDFIIILMELSKLVFTWEKDFLKSFNYFVNKYITHIPCLTKTPEEKNMERWYFFLEYEDFIKEIKKHLHYLHRIFIKHKVKDLKVNECINTNNFLKMCKDLAIIPVFLSSKEIISIINFVKYRKKSLIPTNNFDFCSFVEIICLIALQAFDKYMHEETKQRYLEHVEKLRIFLKYIDDKV